MKLICKSFITLGSCLKFLTLSGFIPNAFIMCWRIQVPQMRLFKHCDAVSSCLLIVFRLQLHLSHQTLIACKCESLLDALKEFPKSEMWFIHNIVGSFEKNNSENVFLFYFMFSIPNFFWIKFRLVGAGRKLLKFSKPAEKEFSLFWLLFYEHISWETLLLFFLLCEFSMWKFWKNVKRRKEIWLFC